MRLSEILKPQNIKVPLAATTKAAAIAEIVTLLADNKELTDPKKVLDAVLERETTRTTGIGNGLAIPHGKCTGTDHLVMAIGRPAQPVLPAAWVAALGGAANVQAVSVRPGRIRVALADRTAADDEALRTLGARAVVSVNDEALHLLVAAAP